MNVNVFGARHLERRGLRAAFWGLLAAALALPWGTGAAVKIYLDAHGLPTYAWINYINPWTLALFVIPSSIYWSSPRLALAALWWYSVRRDRLWGTTPGDRLIIALGGFLVGGVGAVRLYIPLFWDVANSTVPAGRLPRLYLPWVLAGMAVGFAAVGVRVWRRS